MNSNKDNKFLDSSIMLLFLLGQLTASMYLPALPSLMRVFLISKPLILSIVSIFFIGYGVGQLFWGVLSDILGRKKSFIISIIGHVFFASFITLVHHKLIFISGLIILGFVAAAFTSIGNAYYKDLYGKNIKNKITQIGILMAIGPIISPFIASSLIFHFSWKYIFYLLSVIGLFVFFSILFFMQDYKVSDVAEDSKVKLGWVSLLSNKKYIFSILVLGIAFGSFFSYLNGLPFIVTKEMGFSIKDFSMIGLLTTAPFLVGSIVNMKITKAYNTSKSIIIGLVVSLIGIFISGFSLFLYHNSLVTLIGFSCSLLGFGMIIPAAKAEAMSSAKSSGGMASSIMKFTQTMLCVAITAAVPHVYKCNIGYSILIVVSMLLVISILAYPSVHRAYNPNLN